MNNIKTEFTISDLESLSGIKAHTIRIWEKRYNILSPNRSENNIRAYGVDDFRKLLNIVLLVNNGLKISKAATMNEVQIATMVNEIRGSATKRSQSMHLFKLAMMTFDQTLFLNTTDQLLSQMPFQQVFMEHYMPLLDEIGLMWQTATIQPAHEHFISCLIRMVIMQQTGIDSRKLKKDSRPEFILFLPFGEIHELGLLFIHYLIVQKGKSSVYLGSDISLESLSEITRLFENVTFVTYFTVYPTEKPLLEYVKALTKKAQNNQSDLWIVGRRTSDISKDEADPAKLFGSLSEVVEQLNAI